MEMINFEVPFETHREKTSHKGFTTRSGTNLRLYIHRRWSLA